MARVHLTQRRVMSLRCQTTVRDVRDSKLKGYGVRLLPSGAKRYFVQSQRHGQRIWETVGDANVMSEAEARERALSILAALREGRDAQVADPGEALFETVAEEVFARYGRRWKPRTLKVNRYYLRGQILPYFSGRRIADISRQDVQAWFNSLRALPAAANRAAPILSVIMREAEAWGYRRSDSNPCVGIRRYRLPRSERFLSAEEYRRLGMVLSRYERDCPLQAVALRLIALTGCRKAEILTLRWSDYREGNLYLPDSKTGPRTVWLCSSARGLLEKLPHSSEHVFPVAGLRTPWAWLDKFWRKVRAEAGLDDVRLHDLRHSFASMALLNGETIRIVGHLLGHDMASTTLRYSHISDTTVREATEALAPVLSGRPA